MISLWTASGNFDIRTAMIRMFLALMFLVCLSPSAFAIDKCEQNLSLNCTLSDQTIDFWRTLDSREQLSVLNRFRSFVDRNSAELASTVTLDAFKGMLEFTLTGQFMPAKDGNDFRCVFTLLANLPETSEEVAAELRELAKIEIQQ
jgi:hypothetical protein